MIAHDEMLVAVDFTACIVYQQLKCSCMEYIDTTWFFQLSLPFNNRAMHSLYILILREEQSWGNMECIRNGIYLIEYDFSTYALNEINIGLWDLFKQICQDCWWWTLFLFFFLHFILFSIFRTTWVRADQSCHHISHNLMA